ncbi:MAG: hypothetical protein Fur0032_00400 [Terrimicrobiaceae bacterium]
MKPTDRQRRNESGEHLLEEVSSASSSEAAVPSGTESVAASPPGIDDSPSWDRPAAERALRPPPRAAARLPLAGQGAPPSAAIETKLREVTEAAYEHRGRLLAVTFFVAALLALAVVALLGYVIFLRSENIRLELARSEAFRERDALRGEVSALTQAAEGIREPGVVHGRVVLRDQQGRRRAIPGVVVRLYERSTIENHLMERARVMPSAGVGSGYSLASHFGGNLPTPLATCTTDSAGNFEMITPGPGTYVLQVGTIEKTSRTLRLWLLSVDTSDPLNTAIEINPEKEVKNFDPLLMIREAR